MFAQKYYNMRKIFIFTLIICFFCSVFSQIPDGFYHAANGKSGKELQKALSQIINNHKVVSYNSLWDYFQQTDTHDGDTLIWDIYTDNPSGETVYYFKFPTDQQGPGGSSKEFDNYNREHTFCQSWFGNGTGAPYSDLFHIYPVDSYINTIRNNYAYGEVNTPNRVFTNGSKFGKNNREGSPSENAYEPIDDYKGDIARSFFYMATRYMFEDENFSTTQPMTYKSQLQPWALKMLMEWHVIDPVSNKERNRNNAVYTIQQNRNPFIDYPELVGKIWGNDSLFPFEIINPVIPDRPKITAFDILDNQTVTLTYNKKVIESTAKNTANYIFSDKNKVLSIDKEQNSVILHLETPLTSGKRYNLIVRNIQAENLYFIADTSIAFVYGYPSNRKMLFAWTFDSLAVRPNVPKMIEANLKGAEIQATLYMDGQYGSSDFDNSQLNSYDGVLLGDPRNTTPFKGRSLALQNATANGKAIVFKFSTTNNHDLAFTFACRRTSTGFTSHQWEWSLDGENYYSIPNANTIPDKTDDFELKMIELKEIEELNYQDSVFLRLTVDGATGITGNNRFDNMVIHADNWSPVISMDIKMKSFLIFPNPAQNTITIRNIEFLPNKQRYYIRLFDMRGNQIHFQQIKNQEEFVNLQTLSKGSYIIEIRDGKGKVTAREKIIVN